MHKPTDDARTKAVVALVRFSNSIEDLRASLRELPWDANAPLATLTPADVRRSLERFLADELSADDLYDWANLIEGRDDLDYQASESVENFVFAAANPRLEGAIDADWARAWAARI